MLTKRNVGTTENGEAIYLITLQSGSITAEILSLGANLKTLRTPDRNGEVHDIVLGFDNPLENLTSTTYFGQVVGRFANRIAQGSFVMDGKTYHLEKNDGPNSLHSGKSNWGWRNWHVELFEWNQNPGVVLSLFSGDGDGGFPHGVNCTVSYLLKSSGELQIEYEATADGPTPINLTNHSYFNLAGAGSGTILNHEVQLACDRYLEVDEQLIPTGRVLSVQGTAFDFTVRKPIGKDIQQAGGYDHCFILARPSSKPVEFASVYEPTTGRTMRISTTLPAVQMYSGNFLQGKEIGKGKIAYPKHGGICFETQYYPDGPNHPEFPSCIFNKERNFKHTTIFAFGAK
ncbi:MAG: aldose epimerase family protein [Sphaerochaeta sp.]|jgi:aldose 1-epimerase|uniref:aldose epimerase family protein n=1 Tax=Sphaerochaeta sp. TaxID=1972642 RepID=UPI002FC8F6E7